MDKNLSLDKNDSLFVVDLKSVSIFNHQTVIAKAEDDSEYLKIPFLYLVFSYVRNQAMNWADRKYEYKGKIETGNWIVYKFSFN